MAVDQGQIFGRGIAFPPHLDETGQWAMSAGPDNVRESIRVLLSTQLGERLMLADFGSALKSYLFLPNTPATRRQIQDEITRTLQQWEPRIQVDSVQVDADPNDDQAAIATIQYRLVATQAAAQLALNIRLQR